MLIHQSLSVLGAYCHGRRSPAYTRALLILQYGSSRFLSFGGSRTEVLQRWTVNVAQLVRGVRRRLHWLLVLQVLSMVRKSFTGVRIA